MHKNIIISATMIFLIYSGSVTAGGDNRPTGSVSASLGNASVAIADIWSAFNNQAGLARVRKTELGFSYENRFLVKELGCSALALVYPVKSGTFGFSAGYFGYPMYNEGKLALAYARVFGDHLCVGLQFDYNTVRIAEGYGNRRFITFEAGIIADITKELTVGAHIYNPVSSKLATSCDERAPAIFSLGFSYALSGNITLLAETEKRISEKASFNSGLEYRIDDRFELRMGVSTGISLFSFGAGFETGSFIISIGSSYNMILGYSPHASISCKF